MNVIFQVHSYLNRILVLDDMSLGVLMRKYIARIEVQGSDKELKANAAASCES